MIGPGFDRLTRRLAARAPRRETIATLAAAGWTLVGGRPGDQAAAKSRRCRTFGQRCGGKHKCCAKKGPASCQPFPSSLCKGVDRTGDRCCGMEGAVCDPQFGMPIDISPTSGGNCSCCEPLFCGKQPDGMFRCQTEDT